MIRIFPNGVVGNPELEVLLNTQEVFKTLNELQ